MEKKKFSKIWGVSKSVFKKKSSNEAPALLKNFKGDFKMIKYLHWGLNLSSLRIKFIFKSHYRINGKCGKKFNVVRP